MMKRRYFYGLLAGISVLALAACAKSTGQPEMDSAAVNEEKEAVSDKQSESRWYPVTAIFIILC